MAFAYSWLGSLPQLPNTDYSETGGVNIIRSPTDAGPAKQRRRANKPQTLNVSYTMSPEQLVIFEGFVKDTLKGTARFGWPHPRLGTTEEVRIIPQSGGDLYNISYINPVRYNVQFQLEILP